MSVGDPLRDAVLPPPPRDVRFTSGAIVARLLIWLAWFGIAGGCGYLLWIHFEKLETLRTRGIIAQASILNLDMRSAGRNGHNYYATYRFVAEGRPYSFQDQISATIYYKLRIGSTYPVTYDPADPNRRYLGDVEEATDKTNLWMAFAVWVAALIAIPLLLERRYWVQHAMAERGATSVGTVIDRSEHVGRNSHYFTIRYRFETAEGTVHEGKFQTKPTLAVHYEYHRPLLVLYHADNPERNRALAAFDLIRFELNRPTEYGEPT